MPRKRTFADLPVNPKNPLDPAAMLKEWTAADRDELRQELARRSLPHFNEYVLRDGQTGSPVTNGLLHLAWWKHIQYATRIRKIPVILAPMAHAKSNQISVGGPLWVIGQNENFRILTGSSTEDNASDRLETVGRYIEFSPEYKKVFPHVERDYSLDWNKTKLNVKRTAQFDGGMTGSVNDSFSAYGYKASAATGVRCDATFLDDIVDENNSIFSAKDRETVKTKVQGTWLTRSEPVPLYDRYGNLFTPKSFKVVIGTFYHVEDMYADMIQNSSGFCTLIQGVSDDYTHLDWTIHGAYETPEHPVLTEYRQWMPPIAA